MGGGVWNNIEESQVKGGQNSSQNSAVNCAVANTMGARNSPIVIRYYGLGKYTELPKRSPPSHLLVQGEGQIKVNARMFYIIDSRVIYCLK